VYSGDGSTKLHPTFAACLLFNKSHEALRFLIFDSKRSQLSHLIMKFKQKLLFWRSLMWC